MGSLRIIMNNLPEDCTEPLRIAVKVQLPGRNLGEPLTLLFVARICEINQELQLIDGGLGHF